jgi:hypothetical protein
MDKRPGDIIAITCDSCNHHELAIIDHLGNPIPLRPGYRILITPDLRLETYNGYYVIGVIGV